MPVSVIFENGPLSPSARATGPFGKFFFTNRSLGSAVPGLGGGGPVAGPTGDGGPVALPSGDRLLHPPSLLIGAQKIHQKSRKKERGKEK